MSAASPGSTPPTTAAEGYQQATTGGPSFGSSGPLAGTVFALTQTAAALTLSGTTLNVSADTTTVADGATLTSVDPSTNTVELKIPSLSIDETLTLASGGSGVTTTLPNGNLLSLKVNNGNLSYTALGSWSVNTPSGVTTNAAEFVLGYQTPPTSMPTTGTATYSGAGNVTGTALIQGATTATAPYSLSGDGSLTANFGTGTVTGSFTNMTATPNGNGSGGTSVAWDTVSLTGNIANALISGTASVSSSPGNSASLATSGTGTIRGGFYGPAANEVGLVWTLRDATGSVAVGTFGAATGAAPSDVRLKRDIVPVGRLANGLKLYSYAYIGDERRFTGLMAQEILADPRFAEAVLADDDGLMRVDYARLGLILPDFAAMAAAGERAMAIYRTTAV